MKMHGLCWPAVLLMASLATVESTYMVVWPSTALAGHSLNAVVSLRDNKASPTLINVRIYDQDDTKTTIAQGVLSITNDETKELAVPIPAGTPPGTYNVEVVEGETAPDRLVVVNTFEMPRTVEIGSKAVSIFIQTDKPVYKPGQTVQFRAVSVTPDLKPKVGELNISIHDAKNNKVKQWMQTKNNMGVVSLSLPLSKEPLMGMWKIKAMIDGVLGEKEFEVKKYVPPKFEVTVTMKPYILWHENVVVTTNAKYTFGKPVKGILSLHVWRTGDRRKLEISGEKIDGETSIVIPSKTITSHVGQSHGRNGYTLYVRAEVKEDITNNVLEGSGEVKVEKYDVKVTFTKASDDYFKPGLKYRAVLLVAQPNGEPLAALEERREHSVKLVVTIYRRGTTPEKVETEAQSVPPSGEISFDLSSTPDASSMTIMAIYVPMPSVSDTKYIDPFKTEMKQSIQVLPVAGQGDLKVGQKATFTIRATNLVDSFVATVKSRGKIVYNSQHSLPPTSEPTQSSQFTIPVTTSMSPTSNLVVYALVKNSTNDIEMIADSYPFQLDQLFETKVTIDFNKDRAELGENIQVEVGAPSGSYIGVLAVDKSIRLMGTGNDVTEEDVLEDLGKYDQSGSGGGGGGCRGCRMERRRKRSIAPWYWSSSSTSEDVIKNAGMMFRTNALFTPARYYGVDYALEDGRVFFAEAERVPMAAAENEIMFKTANADSAGSSAPAPAPVKVRRDFPETWIFTDTVSDADGRASIDARVPDTITSWVATAFALSPVSGLGIAETAAELVAFKKFFISLNLPYSVKQGEEFVLGVLVFNYMSTSREVRVVLAKSARFMVRHGEDVTTATAASQEVSETITVKPNEVKVANFLVVTSEIGVIKLAVRANAGVAQDALERTLIVEPKGKRLAKNVAIFVDGKGTEQKFDIDVAIPTQDLVPGSERIVVQVVGDILGSALQNLDKLLQMPSGCGEQNMINFAPAIFIAQYLKVTDQLTAEITAKIVRIQETGYQRELNYRREDGSFSAFGQSDKSGSTWLTAFVYKCFVQAGNVDVEERILHDMYTWIMKQNKNGQFDEPGRVIHTDMQGGASKGVTMTAYVVIALLEGTSVEVATGIKRGLRQTISSLERAVAETKDPYVLAIGIYALKLAESSVAEQQLTRLKSEAQNHEQLKAIMVDGLCLFKKMDNIGTYRYSHSEPKPKNVEMAAYILLTLTLKNDIEGGSKVAKCLMGMRNAYGGFSSTQDTVLALQALSGYGALISGGSRSLSINVNAGAESRTISVNNKNAGVLQSFELPSDTREVDFTVNGEGTALIQAAYWYNVESTISEAPITLTTTTRSIDKTRFEIVACTAWTNATESSGMGMIRINLPSGFEGVENTVKGAGLRRHELEAGSVSAYVDQFTREENCVRVEALQVMPVSKLQDTVVQAFPYYQPERQKVAFYSTSQLAISRSECDLCPECRGCPRYANSAPALPARSQLAVFICLVAVFYLRPAVEV